MSIGRREERMRKIWSKGRETREEAQGRGKYREGIGWREE